VTLTDAQLLRIQECLELRVEQLERKQAAVDHEIEDEVHELNNIRNSIGLELVKRRMKQ